MKSAFMIAAPTSGSGKTTIARGLMALFASKGMRVQPFKCGPDYIDTKFHEAVCGRPSINLDTFMATPDHIRQLFAHYGTDADVCIVEGMMGLFDGYDRDRGSSAEIARVLGLPVVLVVDAKSAAYSVAPLLQGFINFRKDVHIAGVIYNKVGSERHYQMLRQVCDDLGVTCFGFLPKSVSLEQDSRYLGLDFTKEADKSELIEMLEKQVDYFALGKLGLSPEQSRTFPGAKSEPLLHAVPRPFPSSIRRHWIFSDKRTSSIPRRTRLASTASTCSTCPAAIPKSIWRHSWPMKPADEPSRTSLNRADASRPSVAV